MVIRKEHIDICRDTMEYIFYEIGTENINMDVRVFRDTVISMVDIIKDDKRYSRIEIPDDIIKLTTPSLGMKSGIIDSFWRKVAKLLTKYAIKHRKYCGYMIENGVKYIEIEKL